MLGLAGEVRKFTDAVVEALGKSLEKGPAAGGTGFIQLHAVQYAVIDKDGFHVLTANIEDEGNLVVDFLGCQIVGNGFDDARVEAEGCLDKVFAIACRAASHDAGIGPNGQAFRIKIGKSLTHRSYGVAVIGAVVGIKDAVVFVGHDKFRRGRTGIDADKDFVRIFGQGRQNNLVRFLFLFPVGIFFSSWKMGGTVSVTRTASLGAEAIRSQSFCKLVDGASSALRAVP